ncbi:hypothetical protein D1AOALGA4SA_3142 [Olavius algarvensis Delta 1 endosymbiont]|nr:hypothetical protein D1AOALGA4SA_3142 [Olavius algarvensis Delta 1 endosymbiont]
MKIEDLWFRFRLRLRLRPDTSRSHYLNRLFDKKLTTGRIHYSIFDLPAMPLYIAGQR